MWLTTPSYESISRPRVAVAVISAVAAISVGYYAYSSSTEHHVRPGTGLHRSNAIRRTRAPRRRGSHSSSYSDPAGDENADVDGANDTVGHADDDDDGDEWWSDLNNVPTRRVGDNIVNLLFRVSEDNARRNGCVHRGCQCNACGMTPIRGVRFRCANCADFDLCEVCEAQGFHNKTHIFYKIRVPAPPFGPRQMQPVWYTGDPDSCLRGLPKAIIAKLSSETTFERPELEAFWEQWTFMANTEWKDDPDELGLAMDRKTFDRCLVPTGGSRRAAPNLIHDRMFSFYDTDNDGLIGFSEFLHGLSYRNRRDKLQKVFEGYDIDEDGYVSRKDFLRMFRAYYVLYKQLHKDIQDGLEDQLLSSADAQQLADGRQPLSSHFGREGAIPHGDRTLGLDGKMLHRDGSVDVADGVGAVAENRPDTASRHDILTSLFAFGSEPRSRWRFFARAATLRHDGRDNGTRIPDADRPYLVTLIEPPSTLDDLPRAAMDQRALGMEDDDDDIVAGEAEDGEDGEQHEGPGDAPYPTETETRMRALSYSRRRIPRLEKRRRDMARAQVHERWMRRQFYLDEEEGGTAPDDWEDNEEVFIRAQRDEEDDEDDKEEEEETTSSRPSPIMSRSRSSSKVHFVDIVDDIDLDETRSNQSVSTRSIPERWSGAEISDSERDAGKEILYQVTQQAFNELLDAVFKESENLAVQACRTRRLRDKYRTQIDAYVPPSPTPAPHGRRQHERRNGSLHDDDDDDDEKPPSEKSLQQLLEETGYTVADPAEDDAAPRNAVDLGSEQPDVTHVEESQQASNPTEQQQPQPDPTMPQFRPNSLPLEKLYDPATGHFYPETRSADDDKEDAEDPGDPGDPEDPEEEEPSPMTLGWWKQLDRVEEQAIERGGWGRLSFDEFRDIYRSQEGRGNRLDYLGSWIDFCIP